jgi:NAD(P)-dependent dehydrogenase (short-subunit alcohol dehydrogenase family)
MNAPVLAGKRALITGGSRGIGLGIAQALSRNGVSCMLMGRKAETLDAQLATLSPGEHSRVVGDVASAETWATYEAQSVYILIVS